MKLRVQLGQIKSKKSNAMVGVGLMPKIKRLGQESSME
jgi:hypothetical protein